MPPDSYPRSTSFSAFDFRFSRPFFSSFPCQFPMASRVWVLPLVVAVLLAGGPPAIGLVRAPASVGICPANTAADAILGDQNFCLISASPSAADFTGVVEGDETALMKALNLVDKKYPYVSLLFYASWCPFSKSSRPNFTVLSFLFPGIYHFAVEESSIRTSILSKYGAHGFPTLFLLNSTTRVRYRGSRTLDSLVVFYNDVTGIKPTWLDASTFRKILNHLNNSKIEETQLEEFCPFSWARSPEKLLRQETYLFLATAFVVLRFLHFLCPTLLASVNQAWRRQMRNIKVMKLWDNPQVYIRQLIQVFTQLWPCQKSNLQEGAMNAKAWASKSLASVSIGDTGTSRVPSPGD